MDNFLCTWALCLSQDFNTEELCSVSLSQCQLQKPLPDNIQSTVLVVCIPALCLSVYDCYLLAGVYQGVLCVEKTQCQAPWRIMQN